VPGNCELDLKALAKATGDKKIDTVPLKEVEPLTGYIRGGVTALACKKPYPVYLDETVQLFDMISISAGMRGLQVLMAPDDYIRVTGAQVAPISGLIKSRKMLRSALPIGSPSHDDIDGNKSIFGNEAQASSTISPSKTPPRP
jgi:hypothetical protein